MNRKFSAHAAFQQYRLTVIATWPDSDCKRAALAAAEAAFQAELAFENAACTAAAADTRSSQA